MAIRRVRTRTLQTLSVLGLYLVVMGTFWTLNVVRHLEMGLNANYLELQLNASLAAAALDGTSSTALPQRTQAPPKPWGNIPDGDHFRRVVFDTPGSSANQAKPVVLELYSAFLDDRQRTPLIRVLAMADPGVTEKKMETIRCILEDPAGNLTSVSIKPELLKEQKGRAKGYAGFFMDCQPLKMASYKRVTFVSSDDAREVERSQKLPQNATTLAINNFGNRTRKKGEEELMALCLKPFHNRYNRAVWLVEFLEFYRMMGVSHFIFYNTSTGDDVEKVLQHYLDRNLGTILSWDLHAKKIDEVGSVDYKDMVISHILTMNDCNMRTVGRFPFVVHVDLDEYIIPRQYVDTSLASLIRRLSNGNSSSDPSKAAFVFRNLFFYLYWENDTTVMSDGGLGREVFPEFSLVHLKEGETMVRPYLITQTKTRRVSEAYKPHDRSKYIVRPRGANQLGHHFVQTYFPGYKEFQVPLEDGTSNHYRICEYGGFKCLERKSEIDRHAQKWAAQLLPRIRNVCEEVFKGEPCPVTPAL